MNLTLSQALQEALRKKHIPFIVLENNNIKGARNPFEFEENTTLGEIEHCLELYKRKEETPLSLEDFKKTRREDEDLIREWSLRDDNRIAKVIFFDKDVYIHQYQGEDLSWYVMYYRDECKYDTEVEATEALYNEFYLQECF